MKKYLTPLLATWVGGVLCSIASTGKILTTLYRDFLLLPVLGPLTIGLVTGVLVVVFWWKSFHFGDPLQSKKYRRFANLCGCLILTTIFFCENQGIWFGLAIYTLILPIGLTLIQYRLGRNIQWYEIL